MRILRQGMMPLNALALLLTLLILGQAGARPILPPREEKKKEAPPASAGLEVGNAGLFLNSQLTDADPNDTKRTTCHAKLFLVRMLKGRTYTIDMISNEIDSYLRLESPAGHQLAEDDDGGGFPNARIVFRATEDGVHRVIGTSFVPATGAFTLNIREQ